MTTKQNIIQNINPINKIRKDFNDRVLKATYDAQKKYNFEIGKGKHATWNNEADAFKHAYMQADLAINYSSDVAKYLGDMHEKETPNAPDGERNMDLWNNAIGREIADDIKNVYKDNLEYYSKDFVSEIITERIMEKMKSGELITNPDDKRKFENMELERLKEQDRVFSAEEYDGLDETIKKMVQPQFMDYIVDNDWKVPHKKDLDKAVQSGDMIYVDNYTRADGTKVSGYYRRRRTVK